eukprot:scaffold134061_cov35-Tisochrysis_lutea.AAC.6
MQNNDEEVRLVGPQEGWAQSTSQCVGAPCRPARRLGSGHIALRADTPDNKAPANPSKLTSWPAK